MSKYKTPTKYQTRLNKYEVLGFAALSSMIVVFVVWVLRLSGW